MVTSTSRTDVIERQIFQARTRMQSAYMIFHRRQQEFNRLRDLLVTRGEWREFCSKHGWNTDATATDHCAELQ